MNVRVPAVSALLLMTTGCWPFIWELQQTDGTQDGFDSGLFTDLHFVIDEPSNGATYASGTDISFGGHFEGSYPEGAYVEWYSENQGYLFEGEYGYSGLDDGTHVIRAEAFGGGNSALDTVTITVGGGTIDDPDPPLTTIDLMVGHWEFNFSADTSENQAICGRDSCSCRATVVARDLVLTAQTENQLTFQSSTTFTPGACDWMSGDIWFPTTTTHHTIEFDPDSAPFEVVLGWILHERPQTTGAADQIEESLGLYAGGTSLCPGCNEFSGAGSLPIIGPPNLLLGNTIYASWNGFAGSKHLVPSPGDLVITEVMVDSAHNPGHGGQWFELYNRSGSSLSLWGCEFSNSVGDSFVPGDYYMPADSHATLGVAPEGFNVGGLYRHVRFEAGDSIRVDCQDVDSGNPRTIDTVAWTSAWPSAPGASMQLNRDRTDTTQNDDPSSWCVSTMPFNPADYGTPNQLNDTCP